MLITEWNTAEYGEVQREEGREEEREEIARNMKANNVPAGEISKYTGLSGQRIEEL
jgi:hypothetical protein